MHYDECALTYPPKCTLCPVITIYYLPDIGEKHLRTVVKIPALNSMLEMDNLQYLVLNCAVVISSPPPCLCSLHQWHGGSQAPEGQPDPIQWHGQEGRQRRQPGRLRGGRRRPVQRGRFIHRPVQWEEGKRHGGGQRKFGGSFPSQRHELLCVTAWICLVTFDPSDAPPPCHTITRRTFSVALWPRHHTTKEIKQTPPNEWEIMQNVSRGPVLASPWLVRANITWHYKT